MSTLHSLRKLTIAAVTFVPLFCIGIAPPAAAQGQAPAAGPAALSRGPLVLRTVEVPQPAIGTVSEHTFHQGEHMVARMMRLGVGARIAEHHHPSFEETFVVQQGAVELMLDDKRHVVGAGDVVYMPAGTVISGINNGPSEAVVVVTWARNGTPGPLTVPGRHVH